MRVMKMCILEMADFHFLSKTETWRHANDLVPVVHISIMETL